MSGYWGSILDAVWENGKNGSCEDKERHRMHRKGRRESPKQEEVTLGQRRLKIRCEKGNVMKMKGKDSLKGETREKKTKEKNEIE